MVDCIDWFLYFHPKAQQIRCFSPVLASTLIYPVSTPSLVAFFVLLVLLQRVLLLLLGKGREEVVEQKETPFHPAGHRPPPPSSNRRCYCYYRHNRNSLPKRLEKQQNLLQLLNLNSLTK